MARGHNTDKDGKPWPKDKIDIVWKMGGPIENEGYGPGEFRRDKYGKAMEYKELGNRNSSYGWEIDHITPVDQGGDDDIDNLQPLNWNSNVLKGKKKN